MYSFFFQFWIDLKSGYDRFEVSRKPPEFYFCDGRYRFGRKSLARDATGPLAACPTAAPDSDTVAARTASDLQAMKTLLDEGYSRSFAYRDGGMHPTFRSVLARQGAKTLSRRTSSTLVPVSRPRAALEDPFSTQKPVKIDATQAQ